MSTVFFDLETVRGPDECGGWANADKFGLAVAVTWTEDEDFRDWYEDDAADLIEYLLGFERIVGFNLIDFDYRVLSAYRQDAPRLLTSRTTDILQDIHRELGRRVKLDDVAKATLGRGKTGTGDQAIRWWREGKRDLVAQYCRDDVALTRDLYLYGVEHGKIFFE